MFFWLAAQPARLLALVPLPAGVAFFWRKFFALGSYPAFFMSSAQHKKRTQQRTELGQALQYFRRAFYSLAAFSFVVNLVALAPALYMLQVYDRVLASQNRTTLLVLSLLVVGLYVLSGLLQLMRSSVLIRVGNKFDAMLGERVFTAAFERNLRRQGGSPVQALRDLDSVRQFMAGNALFGFFDTPFTPIYITVAFIVHPMLGLINILGLI